jgi:hypothetical protein
MPVQVFTFAAKQFGPSVTQARIQSMNWNPLNGYIQVTVMYGNEVEGQFVPAEPTVQ